MSTKDRSLVDRLLRVSLPSGPTSDAIRGDLDQEFRARRRAGRVGAGVWYAAQALSVILWAAFDRARGRPWSGERYRSPTQHGDGRGRYREQGEFLGTVVRTIGLALRRIRRAPGFTASVVVILALGIGANAVMFEVVDRLLLSPPQHVVRSDEVRHLYIRRTISNEGVVTSRSAGYPDFTDVLHAASFQRVAAYADVRRSIAGRGETANVIRLVQTSPSLFPLLGVQPVLGRFFDEADDERGASPTVVLSHEYWEREFGGDPAVLGRSLDIDRGTYTVVGVAPAGFTGAELSPVDVWLPLLLSHVITMGGINLDQRRARWVRIVVRLAPGVTDERAAAEATALHRAGWAQLIAEDRYDAEASILTAPIIAARALTPTSEVAVARWLAGVSIIVLLIACFNVANLLLTRAMRTRREVAVRLALGISRGRLLGELLTEAMVLAALGAAAALLVARLSARALHQVILPNVAFTDNDLGTRLLVFTALATLVAGLLSGLLPALHASKPDVVESLKTGGQGMAFRRSRTRAALLIGQAALSVVLLVGAGLFVRSLHQARTLDLGFDADRVAVVLLRWNGFLPAAERGAIYDEALERLRRLPVVQDAGLSHNLPFFSSRSYPGLRVLGQDSFPTHRLGSPYLNKVGSGYFEAMGLSLVRGRAFQPEDDREGAPPATIITESLANAIWPTANPLGQCMLIDTGDDDEDVPCTEVIGVVEDHRLRQLVEEDPHFLYVLNLSHRAVQISGRPEMIIARISGEVSTHRASLRAEVQGTSSQIRFVEVLSLQDRVNPEFRSWTLGAVMFSMFGLLALVVAGCGLYSVLAFDVAQRRHELGIRVALGASVDRLVRFVLRQAMVLVGLGIGIGLAVARVAARYVDPMLFEVSASDPGIYLLVGVVLLAVAGLAGSLPAWWATRVDPREALQAD